MQDENLSALFSPFGEVSSAKIITDKQSGRSRGFGFVELGDDAAALKAISELDQTTIDGRAIKVVEAKPREERTTGNSRW